MLRSAIRHLAITDESAGILAGQFEETVGLWCWKTGRPLGEFQGFLGYGGTRLALTPDGTTCIVGAHGRRGKSLHGMAAYSITEGRLLWNRDDLGECGSLRLSGSGHEIYCHVGGSVQILETETGMPVGKIRSASKVVVSPYTAHQLIFRERKMPRGVDCCEWVRKFHTMKFHPYVVRGQTNFEIAPLSFNLSDAVFSPDAVLVSDSGIRLIDLANGNQLWHLDLSSDCLAFNRADERFYCVACTDAQRPSRSLVRLAPDIFECDRLVELGSFNGAVFSSSGSVMATLAGDIYETSTGRLLSHIDFPQRDDPDP